MNSHFSTGKRESSEALRFCILSVCFKISPIYVGERLEKTDKIQKRKASPLDLRLFNITQDATEGQLQTSHFLKLFTAKTKSWF